MFVALLGAGTGVPGPSIPGTGENDDGATHVFFAHDGTLLARFVLADEDDPPPSGLNESRCRNGNASHKK